MMGMAMGGSASMTGKTRIPRSSASSAKKKINKKINANKKSKNSSKKSSKTTSATKRSIKVKLLSQPNYEV